MRGRLASFVGPACRQGRLNDPFLPGCPLGKNQGRGIISRYFSYKMIGISHELTSSYRLHFFIDLLLQPPDCPGNQTP